MFISFLKFGISFIACSKASLDGARIVMLLIVVRACVNCGMPARIATVYKSAIFPLTVVDLSGSHLTVQGAQRVVVCGEHVC